jgi:hypothetical protein
VDPGESSDEMAFGGLAARAGLQVALEPPHAFITCEFYGSYNTPRPEVRAGCEAAAVVHFDSLSVLPSLGIFVGNRLRERADVA